MSEAKLAGIPRLSPDGVEVIAAARLDPGDEHQSEVLVLRRQVLLLGWLRLVNR
jgi:hypothetical protein